MKKILGFILIALFWASPAVAAETKKIIIGATPYPHKDILLIAKPLLAVEGYEIEIKDFSDYVQPNVALAEKNIDANFYQHIPYLDNMNKERGLNLTWIAKVHIEPLGLYSKKIKSLDALKKGDVIGIPSDPTNCARALRLLEANGLCTFKKGELITSKDIIDNPKGLKFKELDAAQLPRTLQDVTASVINTNFALEADLIPARDAIIIEGKDSPYANVIVVRNEDKDSDFAKALVKVLNSKEMQDYISKQLEPRGISSAF